MANYKKYAENLIGNWEKDIYAPQKDITKAIYQTNWNKLTNDYNAVKEKLDRNFNLARNEYSNTLNDVQNSSFNRMNNANIDLANRGLSSSGMLDLVTQGDTQLKGESVDKALSDLLATNNASLSGLGEGVIGLGEGQTKLASNLAGDIGKLTDADAANNQQYAGLIAGIAQGAAQRAASRASSGGGSKKKSKKEQELDAMERRLAAYYILNDDSLSDDDKRQQLVSIDIPVEDAVSAISSMNYTKMAKTRDDAYNNLIEYMDSKGINRDLYTLDNLPILAKDNSNLAELVKNDAKGMSPANYNDYLALQQYKNMQNLGYFKAKNLKNKLNIVNDLTNQLDQSGYTYKDLYDAIYGNIR